MSPAPELPVVLQHALTSFQENGAADALDGNMIRECMGHGLEEFLVNLSAFVSQAEVRMKEELALVEPRMNKELAL